MGNFSYQNKVLDIKNNIARVVVGNNEAVDMILTAMLSGGHILLEDVPGTGKTVTAKAFARSVSGEFNRIQFTPDLLPSDVTGINYYNQKQGEFVFRRGPVFTNILLSDEINRATPRTQSALLECMEEKQVTVDGSTYELSKPFMVIATQNPIETAGTYELPEAQLDRFLMQISLGYPSKEEELAIINRFMSDSPLEELQPVCTTEDIVNMIAEARSVYVHPHIASYVVDIAAATRRHESIAIGVSQRGTLSMINAIRAYAYIQGRGYVVPEDVVKLSGNVFGHRLVLKRGSKKSEVKHGLINEILGTISVPTEDWDR